MKDFLPESTKVFNVFLKIEFIKHIIVLSLYYIRFNTCLGKNQNNELVAIKVSRRSTYNEDIESEVSVYRILDGTGEWIIYFNFFFSFVKKLNVLKNFEVGVPKFYAYFENTEGLSVLVVELLGDTLSGFIREFADKLYPRLITNIAVQMVGFDINIEKFIIYRNNVLEWILDQCSRSYS